MVHGEGGGLSALYEQYAPQGCRYVHSMLRDRGEAEELVQEAFFRLLPTLREEIPIDAGHFAPIFFRTLRNLSIDTIRSRKRRPSTSIEDVPEPSQEDAPPTDSPSLESRVRVLLRDLPAPWAEVLELRVNGGLSYEQIAAVIGGTRSQVRTWIYRARRRLEGGLQQTSPNEAPTK